MFKSLFKNGVRLGIVATFLLAYSLAGTVSAATSTVACSDLPSAIAAASAGDTLNVTGDCTLTAGTVINKQLTIQGVSGATITTSGSAQLITVTADGTVIKDLNFVKSDKANQIIIGIQAGNVTVSGNTFTGQYTLATNDHTSRAIVVSPGVQNVTISDNTVNNFRQPAYINDGATGVVSNNYVNETRGFVVVANTDISFTGNSWGTNFVDIAFIPGTPNNYTCTVMDQIVRDNNNASIDNQALAAPCPTFPATKDDCKKDGYKSFTGVIFKNQGDCVSYVASGQKAPSNPSVIDEVTAFFSRLF
jgi:nitrous oxidase accessory protein NosD